MPSPVVLILAAGRGTRFLASGGKTHKLDTMLGDKSVLDHVRQAVDAAGLTGYLVRPEGGTGGMGESIALGVRATAEASGWLILPADLPLIQPASLHCVAEALRDNALVVPHCGQRQGHPPGFSRDYRAALMALSGDTGARAIVSRARQKGKVKDIALLDDGMVYDIDTLADLQAAQRVLYSRVSGVR